ncbi:MAG: hypothetical protein K0R38_7745, partial [Polyangiaceae bacterium]|nr:hypothetical protein [Polyangiaceae bacterium]
SIFHRTDLGLTQNRFQAWNPPIRSVARSMPSRLKEAAAAESQGRVRRRLLAALRAWYAAGQLGPDRDMIVGRQSGARC